MVLLAHPLSAPALSRATLDSTGFRPRGGRCVPRAWGLPDRRRCFRLSVSPSKDQASIITQNFNIRGNRRLTCPTALASETGFDSELPIWRQSLSGT